MAKVYNNNFTDELRQRLSIVDVISRRVPLTKRGQNYWGCCPFHNEKTPSFSVAEDKGFYHCFGCGEHGDIISFTMKSENIDFKTAIKELADMAGLKVPDYKPRDPADIAREESYVQITDKAATIYQQKLFEESGKIALEYIRKRGFTEDMIKKYRIGYAPKNGIISGTFTNVKQDALIATGLVRHGDYGLYDFFRDKLMFPIFNAHGQIVAFSGRALDGSEPKYINTSDTELFHKRQTIFGFNFARDAIHRANRSIVVEGQIDAIQMQCHGFPETVAPLGTALTEDHIAILCKANRNIVFCFDGDNAGQKAAVRACGIVLPFLRDNSDVRFAFVSGGKDPDEVLKTGGENAMKKIIDSATPLIDFLWDTTNKTYLVSTPGGRSQAKKFLKSCTDKIVDIDLRKEAENEFFNKRKIKWNDYDWNKRKDDTQQIDLPSVDDMTQKTLVYIVNTYPELVERYGEFLSSLNIDFDTQTNNDSLLDIKAAERYIVSLKLQRYIQKLNKDKKELIQMALSGDSGAKSQIEKIDSDIKTANEKLESLINIE